LSRGGRLYYLSELIGEEKKAYWDTTKSKGMGEKKKIKKPAM